MDALMLAILLRFSRSVNLCHSDGGSRPAAGAKLREWEFPGLVHALAFAADGRHLATANGNGTVYILRLGHVSGK